MLQGHIRKYLHNIFNIYIYYIYLIVRGTLHESRYLLPGIKSNRSLHNHVCHTYNSSRVAAQV